MKAKMLIALAVFSILLVPIAACGGNGGPGDEGQPYIPRPTVTPAGVPRPTPTPTVYRLSIDEEPDIGGDVSPSGGQYSQGTSVTVSATAGPGWRFDHWSRDASGTSSTVTILMDSDKLLVAYFVKVNPAIKVILNKVQAIEDCEPFFRPPGEFYLVVVVTDGRTSSEVRIPSEGHYPLYDGDTVSINKVCFSTPEVGDYLHFLVVGFEEDSGICYGQYVMGAASLLAGSLDPTMQIGAGLLLGIIEQQRGAEGFWCDKDDFAGSYERTWYKSGNWGMGSHDVAADPYLRLWFTIVEQ